MHVNVLWEIAVGANNKDKYILFPKACTGSSFIHFKYVER